MDSSALFNDWNKLPNEIKMESVKNLDSNSRLALRSCSVEDWKLVESVPFRKFVSLSLIGDVNWYNILLEENCYSETEYNFKVFEKFQEKLLKILDNAEYIENIDIFLKNSTEIMNLMPRNQKIKVKELTLNIHRPEDCLQQVDASILEKLNLELVRAQVSDELCDLPQFNSVDELTINRLYIRDDQLMKIKSKRFTMISSGKLTANGICEYIKKSTSEPDFEELSFSYLEDDIYKAVVDEIFQGNQIGGTIFVHPSFPEFEIFTEAVGEISMRRKRTNSTASSNFKVLESVEINAELFGSSYTLEIDDKSEEDTMPSEQSREKTQCILTEKMANINYIKWLEVSLEYLTRCWRFVPEGSSNQIRVRWLKAECGGNGQLAIDLLEQIEPGHLKCVELDGDDIPNDVYDMQQVVQADYIKSPHADIQDCQLMKLSATKISFGTARDHNTEYGKITASGANKFIKKCLLDLHKRNYDFELVLSHQCKYQELVSALLEGLDVSSMKNDQNIAGEFYPSEVIVNSKWEDFKLKLDIDGKYLKGIRIEV